jgi:FMN phosphatase YigB (HAD superfamily)
MRHLVCEPYSIENLHKMAIDLGIKRCWFHKDHYDIPKRRINEIAEKAILISPKQILQIIKDK